MISNKKKRAVLFLVFFICVLSFCLKPNNFYQSIKIKNIPTKIKQSYSVGDKVTFNFKNSSPKLGTIYKIRRAHRKIHYSIFYRTGMHIVETEVEQSHIKNLTGHSAFKKNELVTIKDKAVINDGKISYFSSHQLYKIKNVQIFLKQGKVYTTYHLLAKNNKKTKVIDEEQLCKTYFVHFHSKTNQKANNKILNKAFSYANKHKQTDIFLPKGEYMIGSKYPKKDYFILPSNSSIIGNHTQLIIDNFSYWFGLATGPSPRDGVSNFELSHIQFRANNLKLGAQLLIMADHGNNWYIHHNTFKLVQKKGNHIFDLGSLQNSIFENNQFVGYAPELTSIAKITADKNLHDYYAEAIQLDAAEKNGIWDAGLIKAIEPNYSIYNNFRFLSDHIVIKNNQFLPFINHQGKLIAYGASIGQHSSKVGHVVIEGNYFHKSLVNGFAHKQIWVLEPIHFPPSANTLVNNNVID